MRFFLIIPLFLCIFHSAYALQDDLENRFLSKSLLFETKSGDKIATLTVEELKGNFEQIVYETETPWSGSVKKIFRGPLVKDVLAKLAITEYRSLRTMGADDYRAKIDSQMIADHNPIFALETSCSDNDYKDKLCESDQKFRDLSFSERGSIRMIWRSEQFPAHYPIFSAPIWVYHLHSIKVDYEN